MPFSAQALDPGRGRASGHEKAWHDVDEPVAVPDEGRIGDRDLAQWRTRWGRRLVALAERLARIVGGAWRWGVANLALVATAVLAVTRRSWLPVVLMLVPATGSVLMTVLGKDLVGHAPGRREPRRTPLETSPAFPSGHALNATVVLGLVAYLVLLGRRHLRTKLLLASAVAVVVLTVVTGHRVKVTVDRRQRITPSSPQPSGPSTARPASSRATGTRNGEHDT